MAVNTEWNQSVTTAGQNLSLSPRTSWRREAAGAILTAQQVYIMDITFVVLSTVFSICGTVTNTINVYAFIRIGWKESVTLTLLALSCSDLVLSAVVVIRTIGYALVMWETTVGFPVFVVQPVALMVFTGNLAILGYTVTMLITTYLAVTRCMCVAKPLHFRSMFTTKRTFYIIIVMGLFPYIIFAPVFAKMGTVMHHDSTHNFSRPILWISEEREEIRKPAHFILYVVLPIVCQVLIIASVVLIIAGLRSMSNFRKSMKMELLSQSVSKTPGESRTPEDKFRDSKKHVAVVEEPESQDQTGKSGDVSGGLSGKELQIARQVTLVCLVFFIANIPSMAISLAQLLVEGFGLSERYSDLYRFANNTGVLSMQLNACTTILIYLKFNTAFRNVLCAKKT